MRTSLLPGIHRNIVENAKHFDEFRLFEIGREIHLNGGDKPVEIPHLIAAIFARDDGRAGLLELKRVSGGELRPAEAKAWEHPTRTAEVLVNGIVVGRVFELHPNLVETGRAAIIDLDLTKLSEAQTRTVKYVPVRRFPSSSFDLTVICDAREYAATIKSAITGELVESVDYIGEYQGANMPEGRKSVSFRITVSSPERTLSGAEIAELNKQIVADLRSRGYELRV
jgi:phenylalanyl-tRNA synthetase beta chain